MGREQNGSPADSRSKRRKTESGAVQVAEVDKDDGFDTTATHAVEGDSGLEQENGEEEIDDSLDLTSDEEDEKTQEDFEAEDADIRSGKIKKIYCEQFMCHEKFGMEFNEKINFITGQNGSGKSAIIAALQVCLGMSARAAGRGTSMSGYIKVGSKMDAIVEVTLLNDGGGREYYAPMEDGTYVKKKDKNGKLMSPPNKYGKTIVIRRIIKRNGSTPEVLIINPDRDSKGGRSHRGVQGTVVSKDRRELDKILNHFQIMVNNPCCILMQEVSKRFLKGSSKDKYKVFMDATSLLEMQFNFERERMNRKKAEKTVMASKDFIKAKQEELENAKRKMKELRRMGELKDQLDNLLRERTWIFAHNIGSSSNKMAQTLAKKKERLTRRQSELDSANVKVQEQEDASEKYTVDLHKAKGRLDAFDEDARRFEEQLDATNAKRRAAIKNAQQYKRAVQGAQKSLAVSQSRLNEIDAREAGADEERRKRQKKLDAAKGESDRIVAEAEAQIEQLNERKHGMGDRFEQASDQVKSAFGEMKRLEAEALEHSNRIRHLQDVARDSTARFGSDVPRVLAELASNPPERFTKPPVHIGLNTELKPGYEDWWKPAEKHLLNYLNQFQVNAREDIKSLNALCRRIKVEKMPKVIYVGKFTGQPYAPKERADLSAHPKAVLLLDALTFKNNDVQRALMDDASIDTIAMVATAEEAANLMFQRANDGRTVRAPRGLQRTLDKGANVYQVKSGAEYKLSDHGRSGNAPRFFGGRANPQAEIAVAKRDEARAKQQLGGTIEKLKRLRAEEQRLKVEDRSLDTEINKTLKRKNAALIKVSRLEEEGENEQDKNEEAAIERERHLTHIETQKEAIQTEKANEEKANTIIKQLEKEMEPIEKETQKIRDMQQDVKSEISRLTNEMDQYHEQVRNIVAKQKSLERKVEQAAADAAEAQEALRSEQAKYEEARAAALEFCGGQEVSVEEGRTLDGALADITQVEKAIEREKKRIAPGEDINVILVKQQHTVKLLRVQKEKLVALYKSNKDTLKKFREGHQVRQAGLHDLKDYVQQTMNNLFQSYISRRQHKARLVFDDEEETLNMIWEKDQHTSSQDDNDDDEAAPAVAADAGALSGGEKSFTQLSFLVAMGNLIDSPFRVMDEFDVFMDQSNRKLSMNLLLEVARDEKSKGRQYLFITPHDISMIPSAPDIAKRRMAPKTNEYGPGGRRSNQTSINFTPKRVNGA